MTGSRGGSSTVTPAGQLRKTVYFSPAEWAAMERECRQRRDREGGQFGVATLLGEIVRARYGLRRDR